MSEPKYEVDFKTVSGVKRAPYHFVAWGRLFGGLAISVFGAFGLHAIQNKDANALSIVASVSGLVLNGWGFAATNLSPRAKREDVIWAWLLFGLLLASLGANAYYNRRDYGIVFTGIELFAIATAAALGLAAFVIAGFFYKRRIATDHERRGRSLIAMMASALVFWPLLRWPALALALSGAIGPSEDGDVERFTAATMRRDMSPTLLRWGVRMALKSENAERRGRAIDASRTGDLLDASELTAVVLNDPSEFVRIDALHALSQKDPKSAAAAIVESVKRKTALPRFFYSEYIASLSPDQLELIFDSEHSDDVLFYAYAEHSAALLLAAVKKFGMTATVDRCFKGSYFAMHEGDRHSVARIIFMNSGTHDKLELFKIWKPTASKVYFSKPDMNSLWPNYPSGARFVFDLAFRSSNSKVLDAAYQNLLASLSNPQALRSLVESADGTPDERLRAACKKLSDSLEIFRSRRNLVE